MLSEKEQREKDARQRELSLLVGRRLTGVTGTSERIKPQKNLSHECVAAKYTAAVPLPLAGTADAIRFPKVPMAASPKLRHYLTVRTLEEQEKLMPLRSPNKFLPVTYEKPAHLTSLLDRYDKKGDDSLSKPKSTRIRAVKSAFLDFFTGNGGRCAAGFAAMTDKFPGGEMSAADFHQALLAIGFKQAAEDVALAFATELPEGRGLAVDYLAVQDELREQAQLASPSKRQERGKNETTIAVLPAEFYLTSRALPSPTAAGKKEAESKSQC